MTQEIGLLASGRRGKPVGIQLCQQWGSLVCLPQYPRAGASLLRRCGGPTITGVTPGPVSRGVGTRGEMEAGTDANGPHTEGVQGKGACTQHRRHVMVPPGTPSYQGTWKCLLSQEHFDMSRCPRRKVVKTEPSYPHNLVWLELSCKHTYTVDRHSRQARAKAVECWRCDPAEVASFETWQADMHKTLQAQEDPSDCDD